MKFAAYLLYCVLAGSLWMAEAVLAPSWPGLLRICWHDAVVAAAFVVLALRSGDRPDWRVLLEVGGWCTLLFAGPALIAQWAGGRLGNGLATLVVALIPVATVFVRSQQDEDAMGLLLPAAVGVAGLGLVIPFALPSSAAGARWMGVAVLFALGMAFAGLRLHRLLRNVPLAWAATVGAGCAALATGLAWAAGTHGPVVWDWTTLAMETAWGLVVDGALVWLVLWLLRELEPIACSGRFLLVPVVTLVGGILVEKPEVGWAGWLGLVLAAGASVVLFRPRALGFFR